MKAMLIWSDGTEINHSIYEDKDGISGVDRAVAQMHKEYTEHGDTPDDEYGSYEGERSCSYCNDGEDMCQWQVIELPEEKTVTYLPIQNYPDACELLGGMVDVVEDFLEDKGITAEMLPNADREEGPDGALIYGSDYDTLADEFARSLGISRNYEDYEDDDVRISQMIENLPTDLLNAIYRNQNLMNRIQDAKDHAEDMGIDISEADAKEIAEEFIDNHDCNQTENDQFEGIINEFVKSRETERGY